LLAVAILVLNYIYSIPNVFTVVEILLNEIIFGCICVILGQELELKFGLIHLICVSVSSSVDLHSSFFEQLQQVARARINHTKIDDII